MGASTTQGTGAGAAFPGQTGPGNGRNVFISNNQPHIVAQGFLDGPGGIASGLIVVTFGTPLQGSGATYEVILHRELGSGTETVLVSTKTDDSDGNFSGFSVTISGNTDYRMLIYKNLPTMQMVVTGPF